MKPSLGGGKQGVGAEGGQLEQRSGLELGIGALRISLKPGVDLRGRTPRQKGVQDRVLVTSLFKDLEEREQLSKQI